MGAKTEHPPRPCYPRAEKEAGRSLKHPLLWWPQGHRVGGGDRPTEQPWCVFAVMFCGMAGFSDFYKLRWLEAILSWQKPHLGCFGKPGELPGRRVGGVSVVGHSRNECMGTEH